MGVTKSVHTIKINIHQHIFFFFFPPSHLHHMSTLLFNFVLYISKTATSGKTYYEASKNIFVRLTNTSQYIYNLDLSSICDSTIVFLAVYMHLA